MPPKIKPARNIEIVDEPSTSTAYSSTNGFPEDPPEEMITSLVGLCGRWRTLVTVVFCVSMAANGIQTSSMPFLHQRHIKFNCTQNTDQQNKIDPCYTADGNLCKNFTFGPDQGYTITEKYALICDHGFRISVIKLVFKSGMITGYLLFGFLSDNHGRKKLFTISLISQLAIGLLISAHTNYWFYTSLRYFQGLFLAGMTLLSTILNCDISSNKCRTLNMGLLCVSMSIGYILLPFIWIEIFISSKALSILYCLHFFVLFLIYFVKESPAWLLCKDQSSAAEDILTLAARFNGVKLSNFRIRPLQITSDGNKSFVDLLSMLKTSTRNMVLALFLIWFLMYLLYAINKNSNFIGIRDQVMRAKMMGCIAFAAAILSILMCYLFKHKITIALASILICTFSIASYTFNAQNIKEIQSTVLMLQMSSYGAIKLLKFTVINMTPRVFPTELRCRGTAVAFATGDFCYAISNIIFSYYLQMSLLIMPIVVSICTLLILLVVRFLYSTHNRELPDLIEDSWNFNSNFKPMRWTTIRSKSPTLDEVTLKVIDFEKGTSISVPFKKGNSSKKNIQNKATQD